MGGGCLPWGVYLGVRLPRGFCLETVCLGNVWPGWVCILACNGADTPFRTESQTGVKTLPFPQNSFAGSKKAFQSKFDHPLMDSLCCIVNKFEHVQGRELHSEVQV